MPREKISAIKNWIKSMGFKLVKSHVINRRSLRINYYRLGNFGVYEEIPTPVRSDKRGAHKDRKFISWTPWGVDFEVNSVKDLSKAYEDSQLYNPDLVLN